jgi:hypothetical protein
MRAIMRPRILTGRFVDASADAFGTVIKLVASRGFAPRPPVSETGALLSMRRGSFEL